MDLKDLQEKKKKKKIEYTPVRINQSIYKELKSISEKEEMSIMKLSEFFIENSIKDYKKSKKPKQVEELENMSIQELKQKEYVLDLFLNSLEVHKDIIKEHPEDTERILKSLDTIKDMIIKKLKWNWFQANCKNYIKRVADPYPKSIFFARSEFYSCNTRIY